MNRVPLLISLMIALLLTTPSFAQDPGDEDTVFGSMTSAEQAARFDQGVEAYDAGNFEQAFGIWLPLAQRGNMSAQRNVGHLLRRGLGVEQDHERAVYFYTRASEAGLVGAMVNLAAMLRAGQGVEEPQYRQAAQWLYVASRAGDPRAQYVLGVMAARGQGMEQNRDLAIELFRLAAEQGLREARERLAEAGIDPSNIGDEPERAEGDVPADLQPLPELGTPPEVAQAAAVQPTPTLTTRQPQQALAQPLPQLRRTQSVVTPEPEVEPEPTPVPVVRQAAQPTAPPPTVQPVAQQAVQPVVVDGPPAPLVVQPAARRQQPEPELDETAPDADSPLGRLLGGTR